MSRENKQPFISLKARHYVTKVDFPWCLLSSNPTFEVQLGATYLYPAKRHRSAFKVIRMQERQVYLITCI